MELFSKLPWYVDFIWGAIIGSFLNVCIVRLPKNQSVVTPRSQCCHCSTPIPWYYNVPVLSWLWLKGRTACCKKPLPIRYLFVECVTGVFAVLIHSYVSIAPLAIFVLVCLLVVAFFTDLNTLIIPDEITLGGMVAGWIFCYFYPELQSECTSFWGVVRSLQTTCLVMGGLFGFASFAEFFLKKEAMGLGDVKLLGCIGAFCGWQTCCFSLFVGAILGTCCLGMIVLIQRVRGNRMRFMHTMIPFGPFIVLATLYSVFFDQTHGGVCFPFHLLYL